MKNWPVGERGLGIRVQFLARHKTSTAFVVIGCNYKFSFFLSLNVRTMWGRVIEEVCIFL